MTETRIFNKCQKHIWVKSKEQSSFYYHCCEMIWTDAVIHYLVHSCERFLIRTPRRSITLCHLKENSKSVTSQEVNEKKITSGSLIRAGLHRTFWQLTHFNWASNELAKLAISSTLPEMLFSLKYLLIQNNSIQSLASHNRDGFPFQEQTDCNKCYSYKIVFNVIL